MKKRLLDHQVVGEHRKYLLSTRISSVMRAAMLSFLVFFSGGLVVALPPTITSFSPLKGPVGTAVTITGTNFSSTPANNFVTFGGIQATVTAASSTSLTVVVPVRASYNPITVKVAGQVVTSNFSFDAVTTCGTNAFSALVNYNLPYWASAIESADFDRDGILDLVTNKYSGENVSILKGNANGTFQYSNTVTSEIVASIAVGDLNGDGKQDLVTANVLAPGITNTLSVLLGNGDLTFAAPVNYYSLGPVGCAVAIADYDGDGNQDVALGSEMGLSVFFGNGTGALGTKTDYLTSYVMNSVATGDFNLDGKPDLVTSNPQLGVMTVFLNSGTGTFSSSVDYTIGSSSGTLSDFNKNIAVGDFNGDNKHDIAVLGTSSASLFIFIGNGTGGFATAVNYITTGPPLAIAIGDFNGDYKQDLGVICGPLSVYTGNGTGTFTKTDYTLSSGSASPSSLAVGDFDGNGRHDIAMSYTGPYSVGPYNVGIVLGTVPSIPTITSFSPLTGAAGTSVTITGTNFSTTLANNYVTFGGVQATVTAATTTSLTVTVPQGASYNQISVEIGCYIVTSAKAFDVTSACHSTNFAAKADYTSPSAYHIAASDFSRDGNLDLATANRSSNVVAINLGSGFGTGIFGSASTYTTGSAPVSVAVGDFNVDGKQDMAVANRTNTVSVLLGTGSGTFLGKVDYATGTTPFSVAVGDFNGDDKQDLVVVNSADNTVSILLGDGTGLFASRLNFATGTYPQFVAVGYFNADTKQDLVVANYTSNSLSVLIGNGDGTFASKVDYTTGSNSRPYCVAVGDFNGDGNQDLVAASGGISKASVFLGTGTGTFGAKTDYTTGAQAHYVAIGDINGDGYQDIITANSQAGMGAGNTVSVLSGTGSGTFAAKVDFTTGNAPNSVAVGDFNKDGLQDIAVPSNLDGTFSVLLHATCP